MNLHSGSNYGQNRIMCNQTILKVVMCEHTRDSD